jgi:thiamine pyrophosphokinase
MPERIDPKAGKFNVAQGMVYGGACKLMSKKRVLIFANGILPDLESTRRLIDPSDVLLAADGGTRHILSLGLLPTIVIGDLDSLTEEEKQIIETAETGVEIHPRDKNETDLELAIKVALQRDFSSIVIVAALGGRLDQILGNLSLLTSPDLAECDIRLDDGVEQAFFTRNRADILGTAGDIVSLLPWGGEVTVGSTTGLKWPLCSEVLFPYKTRGISNEMLGETASVKVESGCLLIVQYRRS